jgi:O-antigen/teichoic acid export membrane protein
MGLLAAAPVLLAVMLPADARLLRRGNLLWHSGSDLVASIVGAGVALTLAFQGAGAWSLAAQYIASFSVRAVILNAAAWSPPAFEYDFKSLRGHVSTGGALLVSRLGELGSKFAENAVFGHVFGAAPLGAYTLANQVSRFANDAVANPVLGAFYAQALRESDAQVAALHARLTRTVLMILLPATAMMAVAAPDVFPIVLGPQWHEAAPVFQAVAVPYALSATAWLSGQVLLKHGLADRSAKVVLGCGAVRIGAVALGVWVSPVAVAWMVGGTYALQAASMTLAVPRGLSAGPKALLDGLWVPALAAAGAAAGAAAVIAQAPGSLTWAAVAAATGGLIYLGLLALLGRDALRDDLRDLTLTLRRRGA